MVVLFLEKNYLLWLSRIKKINLSHKLMALSYFANAKAIFNSTKQDLIKSKIFSEKDIEIIISNQNFKIIDEYLFELDKYKMNFISISCKEYPYLLKKIVDPPLVLYYYGTLTINPCISIVGTRLCSDYGKKIAYTLSKNLGKNELCIVSGMASGIDSFAHLGIIENTGNTIAVLGNSIDICYPSHNSNLYKKIIEKGAIVSEYPPNTKPHPSFFPRRNRIISGFSMGIIVVEAPLKSGTLITVNFALEQGRDVFAFPGNIFSKNSMGTNALIKDGANLITSYKDILEYYNIVEKNVNTPKNNISNNNLSKIENDIYKLITIEGTSIEVIVAATKHNINDVISTLTFLEIYGLIKRIPGQKFALKI